MQESFNACPTGTQKIKITTNDNNTITKIKNTLPGINSRTHGEKSR